MILRDIPITIGRAKLLADVELVGQEDDSAHRVVSLHSRVGTEMPLNLLTSEQEAGLIGLAVARREEAPDGFRVLPTRQPCDFLLNAGLGCRIPCERDMGHTTAHKCRSFYIKR